MSTYLKFLVLVLVYLTISSYKIISAESEYKSTAVVITVHEKWEECGKYCEYYVGFSSKYGTSLKPLLVPAIDYKTSLSTGSSYTYYPDYSYLGGYVGMISEVLIPVDIFDLFKLLRLINFVLGVLVIISLFCFFVNSSIPKRDYSCFKQ